MWFGISLLYANLAIIAISTIALDLAKHLEAVPFRIFTHAAIAVQTDDLTDSQVGDLSLNKAGQRSSSAITTHVDFKTVSWTGYCAGGRCADTY
ncbi:hypothetical protein EVAR_55126_1 [Eumeta japonica]|uniref:Uncharacterized protein n=1 Tax=Eumeta variegata TaxID=151549 RepID=A0A4C1Y8V8_EUMVA|nr:hypothetical protein EVAR_55126_1 [Eumeta japonica]